MDRVVKYNWENRIHDLNDLHASAQRKEAVVVPGTNWANPKPAAFMINLPGSVLCRLFNRGMFIYRRKSEW